MRVESGLLVTRGDGLARGTPQDEDGRRRDLAAISIARPRRLLRADQPELRADLVLSQLLGLGLVRYVLRLEPLASAPPDQVVDWIAPSVQRYLTGKLEPRRAAGRATQAVQGRRRSGPSRGAAAVPRS